MVKLVIFITGHWRKSFENNYLKDIIDEFYNSLDTVDIYVHTWDVLEVAQSYRKIDDELINVEINDSMINNYMKIKYVIIEKQNINMIEGICDNFGGSRKFTQSCLANKYTYYALLKLHDRIMIDNCDYDIILRMRPDMYRFFDININLIKKMIIQMKKDVNANKYITGLTYKPGKAIGDNMYYMSSSDFRIFICYMRYKFDDINCRSQKICSEAYISSFIKKYKFKSKSVYPNKNLKNYIKFYLMYIK